MNIWRRSFVTVVLLLGVAWTLPAFAHQSPSGCTGSGLGITLFSNLAQVHVGDTISYSVVVFNGTGIGPIVCDATGIQASLVTPDGVNHPITLVRTSLSSGESDTYMNVVTYVAQSAHINMANGTLAATASDTGVIHQNVTDSAGGANQGLNVFVLSDLHIIKTVINDNGGIAVASDFLLSVKDGGVDVSGSPAAGTSAPGTLYSLTAGTYTVSEGVNTSYTQSFSGDCNSSGVVTLLSGEDKTCTITNNDILSPTPTPIPAATPTPTPPPSSSGGSSDSGPSDVGPDVDSPTPTPSPSPRRVSSRLSRLTPASAKAVVPLLPDTGFVSLCQPVPHLQDR